MGVGVVSRCELRGDGLRWEVHAMKNGKNGPVRYVCASACVCVCGGMRGVARGRVRWRCVCENSGGMSEDVREDGCE